MKTLSLILIILFFMAGIVSASAINRDVLFEAGGRMNYHSVAGNDVQSAIKAHGTGELQLDSTLAVTTDNLDHSFEAVFATAENALRRLTVTAGVRGPGFLYVAQLRPDRGHGGYIDQIFAASVTRDENDLLLARHYDLHREAKLDWGLYRHILDIYTEDGLSLYEVVRVMGQAYILDQVDVTDKRR